MYEQHSKLNSWEKAEKVSYLVILPTYVDPITHVFLFEPRITSIWTHTKWISQVSTAQNLQTERTQTLRLQQCVFFLSLSVFLTLQKHFIILQHFNLQSEANPACATENISGHTPIRRSKGSKLKIHVVRVRE